MCRSSSSKEYPQRPIEISVPRAASREDDAEGRARCGIHPAAMSPRLYLRVQKLLLCPTEIDVAVHTVPRGSGRRSLAFSELRRQT